MNSIQKQTQNVADQGRYGDTMLMHVNPAEVRGLSQVMPLTINPDTGQPEAFLPMLAPLIMSGIGGAMGMGLLGTSLMSGLGTWAVTGDFKKGLLGAVTGYGMGSAANAFGKLGPETLAQNVGTELAGQNLGSDLSTKIIDQGVSQAGRDALQITAGGPGNTVLSTIKGGFNPTLSADTMATLAQGMPADAMANVVASNAPTFSQNIGNAATALSQPGSYIPLGIGMGGTGIMESQEQFDADVARRAIEDEEKERQLYLDNPEQIPFRYAKDGGALKGNAEKDRKGYQRGGFFGFNDNVNALRGRGAGGGGGGYGGGEGIGFGGGGGGFNVGAFGPNNLYARPAMRTTTNMPVGMQSGFMPEFSYFRSLNPSATALTGGGQGDANYGQGQAVEEPQQPAYDFNQVFSPTQSGGYQNFYGGGQGAPYSLNPYAPISSPYSEPRMMPYGGGFGGGGYSQPFGGMPSYFPQAPRQSFFQPDPFVPPAYTPYTPPQSPPPTVPIPPPEIPPNMPPIGKSGMGGNGMPDPQTQYEDYITMPPPDNIDTPTTPPISIDVPYNPNLLNMQNMQNMQNIPNFSNMQLPDNFSIPTDPQVPVDPIRPSYKNIGEPAPPMSSPMSPSINFVPDIFEGGYVSPQELQQQAMRGMGGRRGGRSDGGRLGYADGRTLQPALPPVDPSMMQPPVDPSMMQVAPPVAPPVGPPVDPMMMQPPVDPMMANAPIQEEQAMKTRIPEANNATPEEIMADPLTQELISFLVGETEDIQILNTFIDKYGNETYQMIKAMVMEQIAPGATTEGLIQGEGTGLSDSIPGTIGAREQIAVSNEEYIVPADVLYGLGDGDVKKGQDEMDAMLDRTRMASKGTKQAPNKVNPRKILPA